MNFIFILRAAPIFTYQESVVRSLCDKGHSVTVLLDPVCNEGKNDRAIQQFAKQTPNIIIGKAIRSRGPRRWILVTARELLNYSSYLYRNDRSVFFKVQEQLVPPPFRRLSRYESFRKFLLSGIVQSLLKKIERAFSLDKKILQWLLSHRPDAVIATPTNIFGSGEVEYVKAANFLGIPTVIPVMSWDNLTVRGLLHAVPRVLIAWNFRHYESAVKIHNIPEENIVSVGIPTFDKWFQLKKPSISKETFAKRAGLDPSKPIVLYLGSSLVVGRDETRVVKDLAIALVQHPNPDLRNAQLLVRPHFANAKYLQTLDDSRIVVWPRQGELPDTEQTLLDFYHSLFYSFVTVGINTTAMIDAIINDKICVTILTEEYKSAQEEAVHFRDLISADVVEMTHSIAECVKRIEVIWRGEDTKQEQRKAFVKNFIRPRGLEIPAGDLAARAIELAALGKSGIEISKEFEAEFETDHRMLNC